MMMAAFLFICSNVYSHRSLVVSLSLFMNVFFIRSLPLARCSDRCSRLITAFHFSRLL